MSSSKFFSTLVMLTLKTAGENFITVLSVVQLEAAVEKEMSILKEQWQEKADELEDKSALLQVSTHLTVGLIVSSR
jgi:hypothetical protein